MGWIMDVLVEIALFCPFRRTSTKLGESKCFTVCHLFKIPCQKIVRNAETTIIAGVTFYTHPVDLCKMWLKVSASDILCFVISYVVFQCILAH